MHLLLRGFAALENHFSLLITFSILRRARVNLFVSLHRHQERGKRVMWEFL